MKRTFLTVIIIGILVILTSCQQEDNHTENDNNTKEDEEMVVKGYWDGAIKVPEAPLHIIVSFQEDDELSGVISIPVQGIDEYPLTVEKEKGSLVFTMNAGGEALTFNGKVENDQITGTYTQAGQTFPFELDKKEHIANESDDSEFLSIDTDEGTMYGELETPESKGPYPVMIIIPGSGPTDRNGNSALGDNNSLKMVAESLAEQGIASLRYDKRGAGKNKDAITDEEDLRFDQFIDDAKEWVDMLDADERFSRIGITGHSQGSLVGMIAAEDDAVDVFVSLAGAGSSYDKLILEQLGAQLPDSLMAESEDILQHLKTGEEVENVSQSLQSDFRLSLQPFLMSWMQYDPKTEIQDLNIPTLIVNGTRDLQISENEAKKLHEAKQGSDLLIVDTMNHVLKEAPDDRGGNLETYWDSERPLADGLMDGIFDFLEEVGFLE